MAGTRTFGISSHLYHNHRLSREHLLEIARGVRQKHLDPLGALAMARPAQLEGRLLAILDGSRSRRMVSGAALVGFVVLVVLLFDVIRDGSTMLSLKFLTSFPSQIFPENGGIYPALIGSLWLLGLTALISVPLGLGAAVYLEEYATRGRLRILFGTVVRGMPGGIPTAEIPFQAALTASGRAEVRDFPFGRRRPNEGALSRVFSRVADWASYVLAVRRVRPDLVHLNTAFDRTALLRDVGYVLLSRALRQPLFRWYEGLPALDAKEIFRGAVGAVVDFAQGLTAFLENGSLQRYLVLMLGSALVLVIVALVLLGRAIF